MPAEFLSTREARFVQEYLIDACGTQAAIRAGVAPSGAHVWACRALRKTKISAALQTRQTADATRLSLRREDVLAGLMEAVAQAREQANPMTMISGLRELGKMLGFYAPAVRRVELSVSQGALQHKFAAMTDAQLYELAAQSDPPALP